MRRLLLVCFLSLFAASSLVAATFSAVTDAQVLERADLVVVGTVLDAVPRKLPNGLIVTDHRIAVEDVLKGSAGAIVTVTVGGGQLGDVVDTVPGSPSYTAGSRVLTFLRTMDDGSRFTAYMGLGKLTFSEDGAVLRRDVVDLEVEDGGSLFAPRSSELFLAAVRTGDLDAATDRFAIETNTHPELEPALNAAASAYLLTATAGSTTLPVRWNCPGPGDCVKNFRFNWVQGDASDPFDALTAGTSIWANEPTSWISPKNDGTSSVSTLTVGDGLSTVHFGYTQTIPAQYQGFCEGGVACTIVRSAGTHTYKSETFYSVSEADVVVLAPTNHSQGRLNTIVGHELGHGIGLRHSNAGTPSGSGLMSSTIPSSLSLDSWSKEAIATVYGNGLPCTAVAITGTSGGGSVPSGSKKTLTVSVTGTAPFTYQWYKGNSGDTSTPVATTASYQTPEITEAQSYWVRVKNCTASQADSQTINITVQACNAPNITAQPQSKRIDPNTTATLTVNATGTSPLTFKWYEGSAPDKSIAVGSNLPTFTTPALTATKSYWVEVSNACGSKNSATAVITVGTQCVPVSFTQTPGTANILPGQSATFTIATAGDAPASYQWFEGTIPDASRPIAGATGATLQVGPFAAAGNYNYWVRATNACGSVSAPAVVTVACTNPNPPQIWAPAATHYSGPYVVSWDGIIGPTSSFELQEATNDAFTIGVRTFTTTTAQEQTIAAHSEITENTRFYYRVRGISSCSATPGPWSSTTSTLVTAPLPEDSNQFSISIPESATTPFTQNYLVPGFGETATNGDTFAITVDAPWITVFPATGALSAGGTTVQFTIAPGTLEVGANIATVTLVRTQPSSGRIVVQGSTTTTFPFGVSKVTPVTPAPRTGAAPAGTLVIPAVAHADGIGTRFQSDVRLANVSNEAITYDLSFTPSAVNGLLSGKKTTLTVKANTTIGLDDIVAAWFGAGTSGETGTGSLEIRPMRTASGAAPNPLSTFASSRTYAVSAIGTLGQFIPAVPLSSFIGSIGANPQAKISLQQVAQNPSFRTNLGFVEGAGESAQVLVRLLDGNNALLRQATLSLAPYQQVQNNLSAMFPGVEVNDARVEVQVTSPTGKTSAYASVLDNRTSDPLLVFPVQASTLSASRYVIPGVADLVRSDTNFRSDVRIFNASNGPLTLTLGYIPQNSTAAAPNKQVTLKAGEVKSYDSILATVWGAPYTGTGGALSVTAPNNAPVVVTARTYTRDANNGTFGQFIPAVSAKEAVGLGERALQVLQLEESQQYRSNVGLVEVTGAPVTVEISAQVPNSKITPSVRQTLSGNGFVQLNSALKSFGFGNSAVYNGRVSVRVVGGSGKVAAYGSVIDNRTADPTYVPSQ